MREPRRHASGVPAKAPTPDFKTGSQAPRGSRRRRTALRSSVTQQHTASTATPLSSAAGGHPGHHDFKVNLQARITDLRQAQGSLLSRTFPRPRPPGARSLLHARGYAPESQLRTRSPLTPPPQPRTTPYPLSPLPPPRHPTGTY